MQVLFPNPYGQRPAPENDILALQQHIGFSDAYADFLRSQNGFVVERMAKCHNNASYLRPHPAVPHEAHANLCALHSFMAQASDCDVETLQAENLMACWFLEIGHDPAGNPFVEILHGQHRGKIASLDHDLFAGAQNLSEVLQELELDHITTLSLEAQANSLCDEALGLVWFHAQDMHDFLHHGIHCDAQFRGFVVDHTGLQRPFLDNHGF